ncbi:MAG: hypothetical protein R3C14_29455 [Caldilineaceae bacterium]
MQYMLHNGPYRVRSRQSPLRTLAQRLLSGYAFFLKLLLIGCVSVVFFQLVALLLTLSDSLLVQVAALAAWSCGAIPLSYLLWKLDLSANLPMLSSSKSSARTSHIA